MRPEGKDTASPAPEEVKAAREAAGLTQRECAEMVYRTLNAWQKWEQGTPRMDRALFELFRIKTGQIEVPALTTRRLPRRVA